MKTWMGIIVAISCLMITSGCEFYATGPYDGYSGDVPTYYEISTVYSEGVDDYGNMLVAIQGQFSPYGNSVGMVCDGMTLNPVGVSQSETTLEFSVPATSFYNNCDITVLTEDQVSLTVSGPLSAMDITQSQISLDSNPAYLDVVLTGDFYNQPLAHSSLAVVATCDGGATYLTPDIMSSSSTELVVAFPNPGYGNREACQFQVQDTFMDTQNDTVTVSSPSTAVTIVGM